MEKFTDWLDKQNSTTNKDNIFSPPLNAQKALYFLTDYLLGENWYSANPISTEQVNCEIVDQILCMYSSKYRKEVRQKKRKNKKK